MIQLKTLKKYCCEDISKIENYDKAITDMTQTWDCSVNQCSQCFAFFLLNDFIRGVKR